MGIADYMWDHVHGYCDINGHYYDDHKYYPKYDCNQQSDKDEEPETNTYKEAKCLSITEDAHIMKDALQNIVKTLEDICNEDISYFMNSLETLKECSSKLNRLSILVSNLRE